eukprot:180585-Rhodomonas_salina.1
MACPKRIKDDNNNNGGEEQLLLKVKAWISEIEATALRPDGPLRGACSPDNAALEGPNWKAPQ